MEIFIQGLELIRNYYRIEKSCIMIPIYNTSVSPEPYYLYQEYKEDGIKGFFITGVQKNLPNNTDLIRAIIQEYQSKKVVLIPHPRQQNKNHSK